MEQAENKYIPGVCNIGPAEIRTRKRLGWLGLVVTIVSWIFLVWIEAPVAWRVIIFIPAFLSANGYLQGFMHFCAGFGMQGLFNFGTKVGKTDSVSQAEFRAKDRRKAWEIIGYAALIALVVTTVAFFT
jgi:hypothetical protein